jgi:hypothetical protein
MNRLLVFLLFITGGMMDLFASSNPVDSSFQAAKQVLIDKIQNRGDLPHVSVKKQLELIEQLTEFELGRFLIEKGCLDGYWTHYVVTHPTQGRLII